MSGILHDQVSQDSPGVQLTYLLLNEAIQKKVTRLTVVPQENRITLLHDDVEQRQHPPRRLLSQFTILFGQLAIKARCQPPILATFNQVKTPHGIRWDISLNTGSCEQLKQELNDLFDRTFYKS